MSKTSLRKCSEQNGSEKLLPLTLHQTGNHFPNVKKNTQLNGVAIHLPLPRCKPSVSSRQKPQVKPGSSRGYPAKSLLFTGDGEFNQQLRLEAGYSANKWYATGYVGFNNRTQDFSDEYRFELEFGHKFFDNHLIAGVKLAGTQSLNNGDPTGSGNGLFSNNVEFISPQAFLAYESKNNLGINAQVAGATNGRNVLTAPAVSFGIYLKVN